MADLITWIVHNEGQLRRKRVCQLEAVVTIGPKTEGWNTFYLGELEQAVVDEGKLWNVSCSDWKTGKSLYFAISNKIILLDENYKMPVLHNTEGLSGERLSGWHTCTAGSSEGRQQNWTMSLALETWWRSICCCDIFTKRAALWFQNTLVFPERTNSLAHSPWCKTSCLYLWPWWARKPARFLPVLVVLMQHRRLEDRSSCIFF